jgi:hypothetical protein
MPSAPFDPIAGGPCDTLAEAAVHARRPFTSAIVQARIWTQTETGADVVYFVDARAVIDRLNVLLPGRWQPAYELIDQRPPGPDNPEPTLVYECQLTVAEETYTDVGEGTDHKAARSDALKRAGVQLGIGHCLYRIGRVPMRPGPRPHQLRAVHGRLELDEPNRRWLRGRYRAWLLREGIAEYGLPLDHGRAARSAVPALFPADPRALLAARRRRASPDHEATRPVAPAAPALAVVPPPAPAASEPAATTLAPSPAAASTPSASASGPAAASTPPAAAGPTPDLITPPAAVGSAPDPSSPPAAASATPDRSTPPVAAAPVAPAARAGVAGAAASPPQRAALLEIARGHGYGADTLAALVRCTHGATLDELGQGQLQDVRNYLSSAAGARIGDAELTARIAELERADTGAPAEAPARERLAAWLLAREAQAAA